jgi:hypothetical protein
MPTHESSRKPIENTTPGRRTINCGKRVTDVNCIIVYKKYRFSDRSMSKIRKS